jgi:glycosyltransferase involved in cell wall biosynthesis
MSKPSVSKSNSLDDVSVLITNFNKGPHINNIIELSGELLSKGAELIIVDDGSTDGSYEKLLEFFDGKDYVSLVTQSNQGSAVSRNRAIHLANRRLLVFLDFDDLLSITILEESANKLKNSKEKIGILNYETHPGRNRSVMPVLVEQPEVVSLSQHRNEFFRAMGYWRYLYSREFILEQKLQFSPSFKEVGGLFILDDLFWLLHTLSLEIDVLVFPSDAILYVYNTDLSNQSDRNRFQKQVMLFPKAMSIFIDQINGCEHIHDIRWLEEVLPRVTTEHLRFLTFTQLIRTLPHYFSLLNSRWISHERVSFPTSTKESIKLVYRCSKNSILKFRFINAIVKHVRGA